jgi:hypothetical protein
MVSLVLLLLVFILFGLRWFPKGSLNGSTPSATPWPPIVNMCPDFMVSWKDPASGKIYCYDAADIYGVKTTNASGFETAKVINSNQGQSALLLQNPTATSDVTKNPLKNTLATNSSVLTGNPATSLMRWEGVWDGRTVNANQIPSI